MFVASILTDNTISRSVKCVCVSLHVHFVLTGTVLFAPMLGHSYLSVYDGLPLQNILIVAIGQGLLVARHAVMLCSVSVAVCPIDLGEDSSLVKQSQVSLKVKVSVQVLIGSVSEALVVLWPHRPSSASIPHTGFLWYGLCRPSAVR